MADALAEEANIITLSNLERRALSVGQCRNVFKAIKEGEKRATEIEGEVEKLRIELGLGGKPVFRQKVSKELQQSQEQSSQFKKRKKTVGQRKPQRDSVGIETNEV